MASPQEALLNKSPSISHTCTTPKNAHVLADLLPRINAPHVLADPVTPENAPQARLSGVRAFSICQIPYKAPDPGTHAVKAPLFCQGQRTALVSGIDISIIQLLPTQDKKSKMNKGFCCHQSILICLLLMLRYLHPCNPK